mmetsp:Transcript_10153/g.24257  ORF Transcript_10153/g.24257 Transcript_10153/m.24257 type:complete len:876 (+) Transcript_10153:105-2732(+)
MNQQDPPGNRSPRTPTLSPKGQQFLNPNDNNNKRNQQNLHSPAAGQGEESSWWWGSSVWNACIMATSPDTSQEHRQQIQVTPPTYHHSHLDGSRPKDVPPSLMVPPVQVEEDTNGSAASSSPATYRIQPRPQRTVIDEEEVVFYMKESSKPLSPTSSPLQSSPEKPPSMANEENDLQSIVFGTPKRRATFWTVLLLIIAMTTIIIGGYFGLVEKSSSSDPPVLIGPPPAAATSRSDDKLDPPLLSDNNTVLQLQEQTLSIYDTNTFMVQDQVLNSGDSKALPLSSSSSTTNTNQGIYLKQESNGNLVLYGRNNNVLWSSGLNRGSSARTAYVTILQADGNLVTRSMTFDIRQMTWVTNVDWSSHSHNDAVHHGEYLLMLTPDADGLMIVRRMDSKIIWSTLSSAELDLPPPIPSPTKRPTPPPVQPPILAPTKVVPSSPVSFPQAAPSNSPPAFPWPPTVSQSQEFSIRSGPMVGHTTHNSCKFWVFLGSTMPMQLVYWPKDDDAQGSTTQTATLLPDAQSNNAAIKTIQGLQPDTVYLYEIRIQNEWLSQGHFKTAPLPDRPTSFKYVLASCMNVKSDTDGYRKQPVWNEVLEKNIDFAMLPGDTIYLNYLDWTRQWEVLYGRVWYRYLQQRAESNFARFIKTVPTYATWDNHDYGTDYADYSQGGKENSLKAWGDLWPNPYQGSSKGAGNYYSFSWGDADFFVLDCRWYRNWSTGTLFGQPQLAWLEEDLIASQATFKIIVSASDVMEQSMSGDLQTIGKVVARNSISGVLFNSGDIHRNEYKTQDVANWPYRVHQFSSSGIAVVWRRNFAIVNVNTALNNPEVRVEFHSANSPGQSTTWSNDPNLICSQIQGQNRNQESRCTQTIRLSDLTP